MNQYRVFTHANSRRSSVVVSRLHFLKFNKVGNALAVIIASYALVTVTNPAF